MSSVDSFRIIFDLLSDFEIAALEAAFKRKEATEQMASVYFEGQVDALRWATSKIFEALKEIDMHDGEAREDATTQ